MPRRHRPYLNIMTIHRRFFTRRFFTYALIGLVSVLQFGAWAEIVTQKQAMRLAQEFFDISAKEKTAPVKMVYNGKRLTTDRLFTPFYVYNQPRGGFVIISAENKTFPILAYSLTSNFDPDNLSDFERGWLQNYAFDIESIRYDSNVPDQAIAAWQDYKGYVGDILNARHFSATPQSTTDDVIPVLNQILSAPDNSRDGEFSTFYTPDQWQELISQQFMNVGEVRIGYVDNRHHLIPGIVHGKKGDYYQISFDKDNDWFLRLSPAEYLGERFVALIANPPYSDPGIVEEPPFEFYDSYAAAHRAEAQPSTNSIEESRVSIFEDEALVKSAGAGHFDIVLPEEAKLAMLYNLNGSHLGRVTYGGTSNVAHINIEAEPRGFYFALIYGISGRPYGVKLYR